MIAPLSIFSAHEGPFEIIDVLGDDPASRRLRELGVGHGRTLSLLRAGRTSILDLGGSRFAASGELLERVLVRPIGNLAT